MRLGKPSKPVLCPFVERLWAGGDTPAHPPSRSGREHTLPTGHMHIAFRLSGGPLRVYASPDDDHGRALDAAVVGGARAGYYIREVTQQCLSVGAVLRPGASVALFGVPADELAGRHTNLDLLWGPCTASILDRLFSATDPGARLDILENALADRVSDAAKLQPDLAAAAKLLQSHSTAGDAARLCGCSQRHFIARFRQWAGLRPCEYGRVRRFQRALRLAARGTSPWVRIALEAGYSDQSHFVREFQEFAGVSPGRYRRLAPESPNHLHLSATVAGQKHAIRPASGA